MRTEHDLRAVLQELEADAPRLADVLPGPRSRRRPLANWAVPVGVAAVLAIAVAVPVALSRHSSGPASVAPAASMSRSLPAGPAPVSTATASTSSYVGGFSSPLIGPGDSRPGKLNLDFQVRGPGACTYVLGTATRAYEQANFDCPGKGGGAITLYYKGVLVDPTGWTKPVPGAPEFRRGELQERGQGLFWRYAEDSWATIALPESGKVSAAMDTDAVHLAIAIAKTVNPAEQRGIPVPLRIDLPGLYLESLSFDGTNGSVGLNSGAIRDTADLNAWTVGYSVGHTETSKTNRSVIVVNGQQWKIFDHSSLELYLNGFTMTMTTANGQTHTDDEFRAIAATITLASNPADPKTWFDSSTVVPAN